MNQVRRVTELTIIPEGAAIFDERGFTVQIQDEAGGEFVCVKNIVDGGGLLVDPSDWPVLRAAIDELIGECQS